jgi:methionyl-tRNA formyltransferase
VSKKRIVFLGSKNIGFSCLQYLLDQRDALNIEITGVVTKNSPLDASRSVFNLIEENSLLSFSSVSEIPKCDIIISVQHYEVLKQADIDKAKEVAINLHMAPLPEYRGCNQFSFAIIDERKEFGTTLHKMTTGLDDGDIIAERRFEISDTIWVEELYQQTLAESELLFKENIEKIVAGNYTTISQESLIGERDSNYHFRNEINELKIIDENWDVEKKLKYVRATFKSGFEPPYSLVNGEKKYYDSKSFLN